MCSYSKRLFRLRSWTGQVSGVGFRLLSQSNDISAYDSKETYTTVISSCQSEPNIDHLLAACKSDFTAALHFGFGHWVVFLTRVIM